MIFPIRTEIFPIAREKPLNVYGTFECMEEKPYFRMGYLGLLFTVYQRPIQSVNSFKNYRAHRPTDLKRVPQISNHANLIKTGGGGVKFYTKLAPSLMKM